jgi:serine/threonine-protein kinase RsbW
MLCVVRTVASHFAARAEFDADAASDFRMAVDEMCDTLIVLASPTSPLTCSFARTEDGIQVCASVAPRLASAMVDKTSWAWRILESLVDEVCASGPHIGEGRGQLFVHATKFTPARPPGP